MTSKIITLILYIACMITYTLNAVCTKDKKIKAL